jgi:hypothetical protein
MTAKEATKKAARGKLIATGNNEQQPTWSIPAGKTYMDFFNQEEPTRAAGQSCTTHDTIESVVCASDTK